MQGGGAREIGMRVTVSRDGHNWLFRVPREGLGTRLPAVYIHNDIASITTLKFKVVSLCMSLLA